jgi:hypothetical protein
VSFSAYVTGKSSAAAGMKNPNRNKIPTNQPRGRLIAVLDFSDGVA